MKMRDMRVVRLDEVVANDHGVYIGDLKHYFNVVFRNGRNSRNGYHNVRHLLHVLWLCYDACSFYGERLTPTEKRILLIAALFHDFNHSGRIGHDDLEVQQAVAGLGKFLEPGDLQYLAEIERLIFLSEFPYEIPSTELSLSPQILRDADRSQGLSPAWLQEVVFGLSEEMGKSPKEVLAMQEGFLSSLDYSTEWAKQRLQPMVEGRITEAKRLLSFLS